MLKIFTLHARNAKKIFWAFLIVNIEIFRGFLCKLLKIGRFQKNLKNKKYFAGF